MSIFKTNKKLIGYAAGTALSACVSVGTHFAAEAHEEKTESQSIIFQHAQLPILCSDDKDGNTVCERPLTDDLTSEQKEAVETMAKKISTFEGRAEQFQSIIDNKNLADTFSVASYASGLGTLILGALTWRSRQRTIEPESNIEEYGIGS